MRVETGISRLTVDPKLVTLNGKNGEVSKVDFSIAKNIGFGDNEKTTFINVEFWGKRAEAIANNFKKGNRILIVGELEFDQWEQDGVKRNKHKIRGVDFEFVDYKDQVPGADQKSSDTPAETPTETPVEKKDETSGDSEGENPFSD